MFDAACPVTMIGIDVTRAARFPANRFDEFRQSNNNIGPLVAELLDYFVQFHRERFGWDAVPIHDAVAVAEVITPGIVDTEPMHVAIETSGTYTTGMTVCDRWGVTGEQPNASVAMDIDTPRFHELLLDAVRTY